MCLYFLLVVLFHLCGVSSIVRFFFLFIVWLLHKWIMTLLTNNTVISTKLKTYAEKIKNHTSISQYKLNDVKYCVWFALFLFWQCYRLAPAVFDLFSDFHFFHKQWQSIKIQNKNMLLTFLLKYQTVWNNCFCVFAKSQLWDVPKRHWKYPRVITKTIIFCAKPLGICTEFWLHGVSCSQNWHGRAAVARNKENLKKASTSSVQQAKFCTKAPCTRFFRVFFARTICTKCTKHTCTKHELHGRAAKSPCKHPAAVFFLYICRTFILVSFHENKSLKVWGTVGQDTIYS